MPHNGKLGRLYTSFILLLTVLCCVPFALADTPQAKQEQLDKAVKSFEAVLQKAVDKGLLETKGNPKSTPDEPAMSEAVITSEPLERVIKPVTAQANCAAMSYLDPLDYENIADFDALFPAKANVKDGKDISGITRLSMTYLSLGLGAEVVSLNEARSDDQAAILSALGRSVEGYPSDADLELIKAQRSCSKSAALWESFTSSSVKSLAIRPEVNTDPELFNTLVQWPAPLQELVLTRLATHAAEISDRTLAETLFSRLSPESRYGDLPEVYDDSLLYLFALIRKSRKDPRFRPIVEKLAAWDGVFQSRALKLIADDSEATGRALPQDYSTDLASVSMQYEGRAESRAATLQVIKHRVKSELYIDAIDTAKREFATTHSEMQKAVNEIGDGISEKLIAPKPPRRLYALNGYFHDRGFFETYEDKAELLADAAVAQGDRETVHEVLALLKATPARQHRHADYALRHGLWGEARDAIKATPDSAPSDGNKAKLPEGDMSIELVNYMAFPQKPLTQKSVPESSDDLSDLLGKVKSDTALVKQYLSQG